MNIAGQVEEYFCTHILGLQKICIANFSKLLNLQM